MQTIYLTKNLPVFPPSLVNVLKGEVEEERFGLVAVGLYDVDSLAAEELCRVLALPLPAHRLVVPEVVARELVPVIRGRATEVVLPASAMTCMVSFGERKKN